MNIRSIVTMVSLAAALLVLPQASSAGLGLDVSPAKLELSIPIGLNHNIPISVHNSSTVSVHVQATMVDFGVSPLGDYQYGKVGTRPYSLMKYAAINPREFDLLPDTTQQVRLSIIMPATGSTFSGEYAGIVFFQTRPERRGGGALSFSARVAAKIYNTIDGTVKLAGSIEKVDALQGPVSNLYRVTFKNDGNAHVYLKGRVEVRRGAETIERLSIGESLLVERGGTRLLQIPGKKLPAGTYDAVAIVDYGGPRLTGGEVRFEAH